MLPYLQCLLTSGHLPGLFIRWPDIVALCSRSTMPILHTATKQSEQNIEIEQLADRSTQPKY